MELENYICQANEYLYRTSLIDLNQDTLLPYDPLNDHSQYYILEVLCPTDSNFNINADTLSFLFNSLGGLSILIGYMVHVSSHSVTTYFIIKDCHAVSLGKDILIQGLSVLAPSIQIRVIENCSALIDSLFFIHSDSCTISAASMVPDTVKAPKLISNLMSLQPGEWYTLLCLAQPISPCYYLQHKSTLGDLYVSLYRYREITESQTCNTADSDAHIDINTINKSDSSTSTQNDSHTHADTNTGINGFSLSVSPKTLEKFSITTNQNNSDTTTKNESITCSTTSTANMQKSYTDTHHDTKTITSGHSYTTSSRALNFGVISLLAQLELLFARYEAIQSSTVFNFCTYFISSMPSTCIRAAYNYIGLGQSATFPLSFTYVNTWQKNSPHFHEVMNYLKCFNHPIFYNETCCNYITPALPTTSLEYASLINLCP